MTDWCLIRMSWQLLPEMHDREVVRQAKLNHEEARALGD